ncbi:MAG TPA: putative quinol monooxygenase [Chloroflexota bacterium]|nr:putative quinol monooxygenase [Chloroflexota bacterium]
MIANVVKVRIKPEKREHFLEVIEHDALHSEADEPGCVRFNVVQDTKDENVYIFYEVYKDDAALDAHRATPHFAMWREAAAECLDGEAERILCRTVFPADRAYWGKV